MNAAGRLVHQGILSRQLVMTHFLSSRHIVLMSLTLALLFSALGIIYVTNTTRGLYAAYQHNIVEQNRLHVEQGQLLLERSTEMRQSRIQQLAESKFNMIIPDHQSVVIVHE